MKKFLLAILSVFTTVSMAASSLSNVVLKDSLTSKTTTVKEIKGKTYVKLWASWCPACLASLPDVTKLASEKDLDFNVITVVSPGHLGESDAKTFTNWWKGLPEFHSLPVYFDESGSFVKEARVRAYPANVFLNSSGKVETVRFGVIPEKAIKDIMKNIK